MSKQNEAWTSVLCQWEHVEASAKTCPGLEEAIVGERYKLGFTLIGNYIVAHSFFHRVQLALRQKVNSFGVNPISDLFEEEFLDSLSNEEHAVLGQSVMLMLQQGRAAIGFATYKGPV